MLKILIKKQFLECFRMYFVNAKKGTARSKKGIIGMCVFFALLMLFLAGVFFGLSYLLGSALFELKIPWLLFSIMGILSIALGVFGSVFNTFATLYLSKDNDLLLAMPIPPAYILISRMALVVGLSFLYSGIVWIPTMIYGTIFGTYPLGGKIMGWLLLPVIVLLVTVVTCALGWVVALVASKVKNRSFLTVILTVLFLGAYYAVCMNMSDFMESIIANITKVESGMKKWGQFFYKLGMASVGNVPAMLYVTGITLVLTLICMYIMTRTFHRFLTTSSSSTIKNAKVKDGKYRSLKTALLLRELKRFTSSATYMLNCGMGILLMPVMLVMGIIYKAEIDDVIKGLVLFLPDVKDFIPIVLAGAISMMMSINTITTPSISLEGKNLWILKSLPISGRDVLKAKRDLHILLNGIPALICTSAVCLILRLKLIPSVLAILFICLFICFTSVIGLIFGLLRPNFNWTSETMPIKQSLNTLLSMLAALLVLVIVGGGYYFLWDKISIQLYLGLSILLVAILAFVLNRWLMTKGAEKFGNL